MLSAPPDTATMTRRPASNGPTAPINRANSNSLIGPIGPIADAESLRASAAAVAGPQSRRGFALGAAQGREAPP